jgi:hypothetical protein
VWGTKTKERDDIKFLLAKFKSTRGLFESVWSQKLLRRLEFQFAQGRATTMDMDRTPVPSCTWGWCCRDWHRTGGNNTQKKEFLETGIGWRVSYSSWNSVLFEELQCCRVITDQHGVKRSQSTRAHEHESTERKSEHNQVFRPSFFLQLRRQKQQQRWISGEKKKPIIGR